MNKRGCFSYISFCCTAQEKHNIKNKLAIALSAIRYYLIVLGYSGPQRQEINNAL